MGGAGDDVSIIGDDHDGGGLIDGGPGTDTLDTRNVTQAVVLAQRADGSIALRVGGFGAPDTRVEGIEHIRLGRGENYVALTDPDGDLMIESDSRLDRFFLGAGAHTVSGGPGSGTYVLIEPTDGGHVDGGAGGDHLSLSARPWFISPEDGFSGPPLEGLRLTVGPDGSGEAVWDQGRLTFENIESFAAHAPGCVLDASLTTEGVRLTAAGDGVTLIGGSGDDLLTGGPGSSLTGGEGSDSFNIRLPLGGGEAPPDLITDFAPGSDRVTIQIERARDDVDAREVTQRDSPGGLEILINGQVAAVLQGVTMADRVEVSLAFLRL